jgi:hypothetical protein
VTQNHVRLGRQIVAAAACDVRPEHGCNLYRRLSNGSGATVDEYALAAPDPDLVHQADPSGNRGSR